MIVGWLALWLGATGYAYCAAPVAPDGGDTEYAASLDHGRAPQHFRSGGENPNCRQLVNAATVTQPAALTPVSGDEAGNLTFPPAAQLLALRTDGRLPEYYWYSRPPGPPLYLSTSRLLI